MNAIRKILLKYKALGLFDGDKELAGLLDTSRRRIGYVLEGKATLDSEELIVLQQYFGEMGRLDLSYLSVPEKYGLNIRGALRINGSTLDEMRDLIKEVNDVEVNKQEDIDEALKDCDQMEEIVNRYRAELKNMRQ